MTQNLESCDRSRTMLHCAQEAGRQPSPRRLCLHRRLGYDAYLGVGNAVDLGILDVRLGCLDIGSVPCS